MRPGSQLLCVVALALVAGAACDREQTSVLSDPPSAPSAAQTSNPAPPLNGGVTRHEVGQIARALDYTLEVLAVRECQVPAHFAPKRDNLKLGVEVAVRGIGPREVPVNPFYATVTDAQGNEYRMTFGGCEPPLQSVRIRKDQDARGWITFEIAKRSTGLELTFAPFVIGTGKQTVRFDLGR